MNRPMTDYRTWTTCPDCGKRRYPTRAEARKAMRAIRSRDGRLNAYRCPVGNDWHLGHLPVDIIAGHRDRSTLP